MLINCPRCGFQQPKDQYCAQCGVDIESFRPEKKSWILSATKNPLLQLGALFVVVGGIAFSIYQENQQNLLNRVEYLQSRTQPHLLASSTTSNTDKEEIFASAPSDSAVGTNQPFETEAYSETQTRSQGSDADFIASSEARSDTPILATSGQTSGAASTPPSTKSGPRIVVTYAEVGRTGLNSFVSASRTTGQFMSLNDYSAGILPGIQKLINSPDVIILHKEERSLDSNRSFSWFLGVKDPQESSHEIGLTTFFELNDIEQGTLKGNLEILRSWREPAATELQRKSFPAMFEITIENGFFMMGILPPRLFLNNEQELTNIDIYKILNSPRFKAGQSELVIFVQFARTP